MDKQKECEDLEGFEEVGHYSLRERVSIKRVVAGDVHCRAWDAMYNARAEGLSRWGVSKNDQIQIGGKGSHR
jgi:hypothetical protein